MSKLIRLALVAMVVTGASGAMARNRADQNWVDMSKQCGGFSCDSQQGSRAFWATESSHGGR
ncbi:MULTISPECIES: hypothetical protein [Rhodomicrobium]|uniref:hypothetical protein n=1 Tax=Rhodomicrobium TaxID=1068 RepID=UPI000B4AFC45|nr:MULTISPECIES: hypothetical protein [Rhodomicrobium]